VLKKFNLILKYSKAIQLVIFVAVIVFDLFYFTNIKKPKQKTRGDNPIKFILKSE
jgi:hypothetical protein